MIHSSSFYSQSVVRTACLRQAMTWGTFLAFVGFSPLLLSVILLPAQTLQGLGLLLFAFFLLCLIKGLLPYKRLVKKQLHPDTLYIEETTCTAHEEHVEKRTSQEKEERYLVYAVNGQIKQRLPLKSIVSLEYVSRSESEYGIEIKLKNSENGTTHLFLPYFTKACSVFLKKVLNGEDTIVDE